jgi:hypothetical protein
MLPTGPLQSLLKFDQFRVDSQLQNGTDTVFGLRFQFLQGIKIPRVDHEWFFADRIRPNPQGEAASAAGAPAKAEPKSADLDDLKAQMQALQKQLETLAQANQGPANRPKDDKAE